MLARICPLCDSVMTRPHYCDTCHSFVWKPDMLDIHYNVNSDEGRKLGGIDCSSGSSHDRIDHGRQILKEKLKDEKYRQDRAREQKAFEEDHLAGGRGKKKKGSAAPSGDHDEVFGQDKKPAGKQGSGGCLTSLIVIIILLAFFSINGCPGR